MLRRMGKKESEFAVSHQLGFLTRDKAAQVVRLARAAASSARDANFSDWSGVFDNDNAAAFVFLGRTRFLKVVGCVE